MDVEVNLDLLVVTVAPVLIGRGIHAIEGNGMNDTISAMPKLRNVRYRQFGVDMVLLANVDK